MITPKRAWNYFKREYLWKLRRYPRNLQVEVTNRCNSNCEVCPRLGLDMELKTMNLFEFKDIIDGLKKYKGKIPFFHPYRMGEPTLNPYLVSMCRIAKDDLGCDTILYTNGSKLTEDMIDRLFKIPIHKLVFSVEGYGQKQYEKLRKNLSWKTLCKNIDYASKTAHLYSPEPEVHIRYTKYKIDSSDYLEGCNWNPIGVFYRKRFPLVTRITGRGYVDNTIKTVPKLPCWILRSHMIFDVHRNMLMCCCGIKGNELATWDEVSSDLMTNWRRQTAKFNRVKDLKDMPKCCNYCGVSVINLDDLWD